MHFRVWAPRTARVEVDLGDRRISLDAEGEGYHTGVVPAVEAGIAYLTFTVVGLLTATGFGLVPFRGRDGHGARPRHGEVNAMTTLVLVLLVLLLVGALPAWPYSSSWGYYPGGTLGVILIVVLILVLTGRL